MGGLLAIPESDTDVNIHEDDLEGCPIPVQAKDNPSKTLRVHAATTSAVPNHHAAGQTAYVPFERSYRPRRATHSC